MLTDIEIAQQTTLTSIEEIAENLGLSKDDLDLYGKYKAKITLKKLRELQAAPKKGKLILVTAITPTPAGEGKSTISIALADGIRKIGKNVCLALREPSLGPCFGIKIFSHPIPGSAWPFALLNVVLISDDGPYRPNLVRLSNNVLIRFLAFSKDLSSMSI